MVTPVQHTRVRQEEAPFGARGQEHPFVLFLLLMVFGAVWWSLSLAQRNDDALLTAAECADTAAPGEEGSDAWKAALTDCLETNTAAR